MSIAGLRWNQKKAALRKVAFLAVLIARDEPGKVKLMLFFLRYFLKLTFLIRALYFASRRESEQRLALRAFFAGRFLPESELAVGETIAGEKSPALFTTFLNNVAFLALRAFHAGLFFDRLDTFAFRVFGTAEKRSKSAAFYLHRGAALGAFFLGILFRQFGLLGRFFRQGLGVFTLRVLGASHKFAEPAHFDDHGRAAFLAFFFGFFFG